MTEETHGNGPRSDVEGPGGIRIPLHEESGLQAILDAIAGIYDAN